MFVFQETGKLANKPEVSKIYDFKAAAKCIGAYNTPDFYFVSGILLVCLVSIVYIFN